MSTNSVSEIKFRKWAETHHWLLMEERLIVEDEGNSAKKNGTQIWIAPSGIAAALNIKDGEVMLGGRKE